MFLPYWNKGELIVELAPGNLAGSINYKLKLKKHSETNRQKWIELQRFKAYIELVKKRCDNIYP